MKRDDIRRRFRRIFTGCEGCSIEDPCIYCMVVSSALDEALDEAMEVVDQHLDDVLLDLNGAYEGLWTAWEVADYYGFANSNAARARLSKAKIRSVRTMRDPETKRPMALYSMTEVRAAFGPEKKVTR